MCLSVRAIFMLVAFYCHRQPVSDPESAEHLLKKAASVPGEAITRQPPTGDLFRQLKFLEPPVQCAPADPEFFRCFRTIAAAFIQCSHDQADFVVVDIDQILICPFARSEGT